MGLWVRMLRLIVGLVVFLATAQVGSAQPGRGEGIRFGWEETIVPRAELSADQKPRPSHGYRSR